jgi:uncharacterized SAM-binding protein YcdF (DUF218 family)
MSFLYSLFLKLLYPTSLSMVLLLTSAALKKWKAASRTCFWLALAILMVCGNGWLIGAMTKHLEWQYLPNGPLPQADCIVVLSGGIVPRIPPRPTVEVMDAGDRVLYAAQLYREHKAPQIICTGNVATGGIAPHPASQDMAEFLEMLGVPGAVVIQETKSTNTHEHTKNLFPLLQDRGFKRVLLVTSAMHMPRSMGAFRRGCPGIEFIAAPTDFHCVEDQPKPCYRTISSILPTPLHLLEFSEVMHEYLGIWYYKLRGWI